MSRAGMRVAAVVALGLLMPAGSWLRASLGLVELTPLSAKPQAWLAELRLTPGGR